MLAEPLIYLCLFASIRVGLNSYKKHVKRHGMLWYSDSHPDMNSPHIIRPRAFERMRTGISCLAACIALSTVWAGGALEFAGYMHVGGKSLFVIKDLERSRSSDWLALGDSFGGHTLLAFDGDTDVLSLRSANTVVHLPLKTSRVAAANSMIPENGGRLEISVREDGLIVMTGRIVDAAVLRDELMRVAAREPRPMIAISYPGRSGESGLRTLLDACRTIVGLTYTVLDDRQAVAL